MRSVADSVYTVTVDHALKGEEALELCEFASRLPLGTVQALHLSLSRVEAIDTSGIAAIVRLFSHLAREGKALALTDVSSDVFEMLSRTGLVSVMAVTERRVPVFDIVAGEVSGLH